MRRMVSLTLLVAATALVVSNPALATRSSKVAALQVALWHKGFYRGTVSGSGQFRVNCAGWATGTYLVSIRSGLQTSTHAVLLTR